jgi:hypothetical protein
MKPFARAEILGEREPEKEHPRKPRFDTVPPESCSQEQAPFRNGENPDLSEEGTLETFFDGTGI